MEPEAWGARGRRCARAASRCRVEDGTGTGRWSGGKTAWLWASDGSKVA